MSPEAEIIEELKKFPIRSAQYIVCLGFLRNTVGYDVDETLMADVQAMFIENRDKATTRNGYWNFLVDPRDIEWEGLDWELDLDDMPQVLFTKAYDIAEKMGFYEDEGTENLKKAEDNMARKRREKREKNKEQKNTQKKNKQKEEPQEPRVVYLYN